MDQPDLDRLLDTIVPFAQKMLGEHGEFFPFGATLAHDGAVVGVMPHDSPDPENLEGLIDVLVTGFKKRASDGEIRAAGLCIDVRVELEDQPEPVDAICVRLDHEDDAALDVYVPYATDESNALFYGEPFATEGELSVFERT